MQKRIVRIVCFFLILLALLGIGSAMLEPKNNRESDGLVYPGAMSILAEPENTIDVVFLGDSEAYCCFVPLRIWQDQGITSYVCSSVDQKLYETEELLHIAFQKQSPKIVVLETNVLYREYSRSEVILPLAERVLPILRYHDRWKTMEASDLLTPVQYREISETKGYHLKLEVEPADAEGYMADTDVAFGCPPKNLKILARMDAYCRERGAQLVLLASPSTLNWSRMMYNYMAPLTREMGIPFVDTNQLGEAVPIDWDRDTMDGGDHLNYYGADKLSAYLGTWLADMDLFTDKRMLPDFQIWNTCLENFLIRVNQETEKADA